MGKVFTEDPRTGEMLKRCSKCGIYKGLGEYDQARTQAHGVVAKCKGCRREGRRKYKDSNDRFWKYYHSHVERVGNCVEYTATRSSSNLSLLRRKVYRLSVGAVSDGDFIITTCGNSQCVKQGHLKKVSKIDVEIKRINKLPIGDQNPSRKHPERLARGDRHGSKTHPEKLRRGDTHPARLHPECLARGEQSSKSKLTTEDVQRIRELYSNEKIPQRKLADRFGVTQRAVWQIVNNKTWTHI